ncbi:MAG TPA: biotin/lipoyl-containing protein, partial [Pyrinomonadaceae bacterium]|nr:biotin/lipoyl-containing protein [Pyrinomonadaceae bacterium]
MSTDVVMPQMGESIAEGTITKWLKKVGESVERDEPLFEISTDKVDAEIPSPAAGTLSEIKFQEGETVVVGKVVAVIGDGAGATSAAPSPAETAEPRPASPEPVPPAPPQPPPSAAPAPASQAVAT